MLDGVISDALGHVVLDDDVLMDGAPVAFVLAHVFQGDGVWAVYVLVEVVFVWMRVVSLEELVEDVLVLKEVDPLDVPVDDVLVYVGGAQFLFGVHVLYVA